MGQLFISDTMFCPLPYGAYSAIPSVLCFLFLDSQPTLFLSMSVTLLYFFLKASTLHSASKPNLVSSSPSIQLVQFDAAYVIDFSWKEIDHVSHDPSCNSNGDFDKIVESIDLS